MPKLTVKGQAYEVEAGKRLVLAIEEQGIHIGHRCGGFAQCTTCRVEFESGEPDTMTRAEYDRLTESGLLGKARLSCQIVCDHDMSVRPVMTLETQEWDDTGPAPNPAMTPEAKWYSIQSLQKDSI